jgi:ATP-dependent Clp protease protease subunit
MGDIFIYGGIGSEKGEISFNNVNEQLEQNASANELTVHIISPGGDVFEGEAIYNALKNTGKPITTHVEGTCASIATLIAAAGDKVIMNTTARFMIHNPKISGFSQMADSRDLRHVANQLDKIKELLINVYDKKTTLGKDKLWELYDNETWLTATEAKQMGFVDDVKDAIKAVAKINIQHIMEVKDKGLWTKIQNLFSLTKFKNEFTKTLADGRVVVIMSEPGEPVEGKQVVLESGEPLEDGEHPMQEGGEVITVGGGVITAVKVAEPEQKSDPKENEMDNKIKELEAQLAAAVAEKEQAAAQAVTAQKETATAKAETLKFKNRMTEIEKDFIKLQEETSQTVGTPPKETKGPVFKNTGKVEDFDPMGEFALTELKKRKIIHED